MKTEYIFELKSVMSFLAIVLTLSLGSARAEEFREFTNSAGNKLQGRILSATEADVTLQLQDGREVSGGVQFFSKEDQDFITEWRKQNPVQIAYDFEVDMSRDRTDKRKATEGNIIANYELWRYKLTVENRSKNGASGTPVEGLELQYNLVKKPKSKAREAYQLDNGMKPAGTLLVKTGKIDLGGMDYLKDVELLTETIPINHSELAPGWYYADGSKDENNDELEGIVIQIVKDGKSVYKTTNGSKAVEDVKWVAP